MARIRLFEIFNFRGIKHLIWQPSEGVNCLIGPGDSGKSTILEAIELCLSARRGIQLSDDDFHSLEVDTPIQIFATIGELNDQLKGLDAYGNYLRGFDKETGKIEDEPGAGLETVLTVMVTVSSDLEPIWTLFSERAEALGQSRGLGWSDRQQIAPTRIGVSNDYNLSWRKGSILNRVSDERASAASELVQAVRDARSSFGNKAEKQLKETLATVGRIVSDLGIPVGGSVKALMDARSISINSGSISLHDAAGVPLRGLGVGSTRLLIAGLQREASEGSSILLVDELEHGLEPHRIIRLLGSLGAKDADPPLQVFASTHSPVVLRELSGSQMFVVRNLVERHEILNVGIASDMQGTIRSFPDAFLAPSVLVCEGASEVGLIRGLDQFRVSRAKNSVSAAGVALVDAGGVSKIYGRAFCLQRLGYRVAVLRDDDEKPSLEDEKRFKVGGGTVFVWRDGRALEDELFCSLSDASVNQLIEFAIELRSVENIEEHIKSCTSGKSSLKNCRGDLSEANRVILGKAARNKSNPWFKTVGWMEAIGRDILGPNIAMTEISFRKILKAIFIWAEQGLGTPAKPEKGAK